MPPIREAQLRETADNPTIKAIDMWRSLSSQVLGRALEVVVDDRRNNPHLASFDGELNVASPAGYEGQVVLYVWLDSFPIYKPLMLTHEIGHWMLDLRGFRGFVREPRDNDWEGLFNALTTHSPVYAFQKSIGHDPQTSIDSKADHDIVLCAENSIDDRLKLGLILAEDLLNCSWKKRAEIRWAAKKHQPECAKILDKIERISSRYDLLNQVGNFGFMRELLKNLKIPGKWIEKDDVKTTKELLVQIEEKRPSAKPN